MIEGFYCPLTKENCCGSACMFWVVWRDGAECAIHAIAVELNDEDDSKEGEELTPEKAITTLYHAVKEDLLKDDSQEGEQTNGTTPT